MTIGKLSQGYNSTTILLRGTSYEMVVKLFENGKLTADPNPRKIKRRGGKYLYMWPIRENCLTNKITPEKPWHQNDCNPIKESKDFAKLHAKNDYFKQKCGFSIGEYEGHHNPGQETSEKIKSNMLERRLTNLDVEDMIFKTNIRQGYIIGFNYKLAKHFKLSPDRWFDSNYTFAIEVCCPEGISIEYISKITPIGEWDAKLFEVYLKNLKKVN